MTPVSKKSWLPIVLKYQPGGGAKDRDRKFVYLTYL